MRKLFLTLTAIVLVSCQSQPNPDVQALKDGLQTLETVIVTEPLNRTAYKNAIFSVQELSKKAPINVTADITQLIINQAYVLGAWEECEDTVTLPSEMKGYCWEENTPIFKGIFRTHPDIKNDATIRVKYLSNDGYFYSRDKIVSKLLAKTKEDIKLIKSKIP